MSTTKQTTKERIDQKDFGIPSDLNQQIEHYANFKVHVATENLRNAAQMALEALQLNYVNTTNRKESNIFEEVISKLRNELGA